MNKREPEITQEMAKMSLRDVARLLAVTEVRARELLAQMKTPGKPGRKRRVPGAPVQKTAGKRITFMGRCRGGEGCWVRVPAVETAGPYCHRWAGRAFSGTL